MYCQSLRTSGVGCAGLCALTAHAPPAWAHSAFEDHPLLFATLLGALAACLALAIYGLGARRRLRRQLAQGQETTKALAESQKHLQLMLSQMPAITWTTDRELRLTSNSAIGLKAIHASLSRLAGVKITHLFRTRDPEYLPIKAHLQALEGESVEFELDYRGRSYMAWVEPFRDAAGRTVGCIGVAFDVTGRRESEKRSRDNERFLHSMFDGIQDGLCVLDRELRVVRSNDAFEAWCGAAEGAQFRGEPCYRALYGWEAPCDACPAQRAFEDGGIQHQRVSRPLEEGAAQWFDVTAYPLLDASGEPEYVVEFIRDVTQQQEAEDLLRMSRRQYRDLVRGLPLGVLRTTPFPDSVITMANPALARMLGYDDPASLRGLRANALYSDEREQRALYSALGAHGEARGHEVEWVRCDGSRIWVSLCSRVKLDEQGLPEYVDSTAEDVTHRKLVEQSLLESEETFRAMTGAANDGIVMVDGAGLVTFWNPAAEHIFGYDSREALGESFFGMLEKEGGERLEGTPICRFSDEEAPGELCDLYARRKDGGATPVELSLAGVRVRGQWRGIAVVRDVAQRKETEAQQARYAEEMEAANRQLESAIGRANELAMEAEMANSAKTQFLANMSHEIRTPLNGILGMTELMSADDTLPAAQRERVDIISVSGETLLDIINDILDFSKIEAGRLELEHIPFDIFEVLESVAELMGPKAGAKGVETIVRLAPEAPRFVQGDPARLRQVVMNLVGNAVKFTRAGFVRLGLSGGGGGPVRIEVTDTGIGIAGERLEQLFEPFTQSDASTTREFGGTGLGLAISRQLVESMGGRIGVESRIGEGSTFWVEVDLETAEVPEGARTWRPDALAGVRVLAADGRAETREALRMTLGAAGCEVTLCATGAEMRRAALEEEGPTYHAAFVEASLAGDCGADELAAGPWREEGGLFCLTGYPAQRGPAEALGACDAFLVKPLKRETLMRLTARAAGIAFDRPDDGPGVPSERSPGPQSQLPVLLVEDNVVNQKVASRMLDRLGYAHEVASDGRAATEAVAAKRYGAVLMDCQMPGMDGFEATEAIRDMERGKRHTPIVAMTAMAMKGDEANCLAAGMDGYLAKPIKLKALRDVLGYYMRLNENSPPPHGPEQEAPAS